MSPLILACLAATWLIWGSTYLAIKWALTSFPPFYQMGSRFVAAGLLLGLWACWRGAAWPTGPQWFSAFVLGGLMLVGGYGATAVAEQTVSSGLVVAFIAVVPALVALAQWPYGVRPAPKQALGIGLGLVGVTMLSAGQGFDASPVGLLSIALACVTWSLGTVWALHGLPRLLGGRALRLAPGSAGSNVGRQLQLQDLGCRAASRMAVKVVRLVLTSASSLTCNSVGWSACSARVMAASICPVLSSRSAAQP